jgi:hypothetical protein
MEPRATGLEQDEATGAKPNAQTTLLSDDQL